MSAQRAPCIMNDSPIAILSRFSLRAPRSSTWMNRKERKKIFSWQVKITGKKNILQLASENYYPLVAPRQVHPTEVTWFLPWKWTTKLADTFSSMRRLWTNSGLGRETNSLRLFLIPAMFSNGRGNNSAPVPNMTI